MLRLIATIIAVKTTTPAAKTSARNEAVMLWSSMISSATIYP